MLPEHPDKLIEIMVLSALQKGLAELQAFICGTLETVREVIATYVADPTGLLPVHPLNDWTVPEELQLSSTVKITRTT